MDSTTRLPFSFAFQMGLAKGKQQQGIGRWKEKGGGMYSPIPTPPLLGYSSGSGCFLWLQLLSSRCSSKAPNFFYAFKT